MHGKNAETIKTSDPAHFTSGFLDRHSSASCAAGSCDDEISVRRRKDLGGRDCHLSGVRLFRRKDRRQKDGEQKIPVGTACRSVLFCSAFSSDTDPETEHRSIFRTDDNDSLSVPGRRNVRRNACFLKAFRVKVRIDFLKQLC